MTAAILLAAGRSARMGDRCKLLLPLWGRPLVYRAAEALAAAGLSLSCVVAGPWATGIAQALSDLSVDVVWNPRHEQGMGTSIAAGVAALGPCVRSAVLALGDMPCVSAQSIRQLLRSFDSSAKSIALPCCNGRRGHPVAFDLRRHRSELLALSGDAGARSVLAAHPDEVLEVPVSDPGVLLDIDTARQYEALRIRGPA